jgi:type VI secretion system secreted protein Hcp
VVQNQRRGPGSGVLQHEAENVKVVKVNPKMHDIKDPAFEKHNHLEQIELRYEKITWTYKDGNIIHSDSWNERATA